MRTRSHIHQWSPEHTYTRARSLAVVWNTYLLVVALFDPGHGEQDNESHDQLWTGKQRKNKSLKKEKLYKPVELQFISLFLTQA